MKIICLNLWCGRKKDLVVDFIRQHQDIDVFCFQEIYHDAHGKETYWLDSELNLLNILRDEFPNHQVLFTPSSLDYWGMAIMVKNTYEVNESGSVRIYESLHDIEAQKMGHVSKDMQYVTLYHDGKPLTIFNIHGLWNGQGKDDTPERIMQSQKAIDFIKGISHDVIVIGDFNMNPGTESLQMFENAGLRNLIAEYGITSTRTSLYKKENRFADYAFVSPEVVIKDFKILPDEVSDHSPLYLEV